MPKATNLITPPQLTSAQPAPTGRPALDPTTRRRLLTVAAGGAVAAMAISTTAQAGPDPIFAAIDAFHRADALYMAVEGEGDILDELGDQQHEAYSAVLRTRPITPAGLAALTAWARERAVWYGANGTIFPDEDLCVLTAAIDDATRGMSGLKPWSPPLPAAMAVSADPAFALIAEKLAADVAHGEAIDAQDAAEGRFGHGSDEAGEAAEHCEAACHLANKVDWKLATTFPTTIAGVAAVLRFANQIEDGGSEWPATDTAGPEGWHYQLRATMAAAVEALIRAQAGKAVQS
jgi:hypothetical protein